MEHSPTWEANRSSFIHSFSPFVPMWTQGLHEANEVLRKTKNVLLFMVPEGSLLPSQEPATRPHPKPAQSSPWPTIPLLAGPFSYFPPIYVQVFQMVSFHQVSPPKPCINLSSPPTHTLRAPPSHSFWFHRPNNIWWEGKIIKFHIK
jgi:hypothetical protein